MEDSVAFPYSNELLFDFAVYPISSQTHLFSNARFGSCKHVHEGEFDPGEESEEPQQTLSLQNRWSIVILCMIIYPNHSNHPRIGEV